MTDEKKPSSEELARRLQWFEDYCRQLATNSVVRPPEPGTRFACPCCRCLTLDERGGYDICPVCFWEDDGQDDHDAARVRGGPNGALSLDQARRNYADFGACDERSRAHVRRPTPEEKGDRRRTMAFPRSWLELAVAEAEERETELRRELAPTHRLHGRDVRAIARRERRDDVLFVSATYDGPVFCVHLTWSVESAPEWPWTVEYHDLADFLDRWPREEGEDAPDDDAG